MRITEEAGQARSAQKLMGPFQGTGMRSDDWALKFPVFANVLRYLNVVKGMVLNLYFIDNILNFINENVISPYIFSHSYLEAISSI